MIRLPLSFSAASGVLRLVLPSTNGSFPLCQIGNISSSLLVRMVQLVGLKSYFETKRIVITETHSNFLIIFF